MAPYFIDWSLIFIYRKKEHKVQLIFSDALSERQNLDFDELIIEGETLECIIHKYDYRKLNYFTKDTERHVFDTVMRLVIPELGKTLRTKAVCIGDAKGFRCLNFEQVKLMKLRALLNKNADKKSSVVIKIQNLRELSPKNKRLVVDLEAQLAIFFNRESKTAEK